MVCVGPGSVVFTSLTLLLLLRKDHAGVYQYDCTLCGTGGSFCCWSDQLHNLAVHLLTCLGFMFVIQQYFDTVLSSQVLCTAGHASVGMCRTICTALPENHMCSITMHADKTRCCTTGYGWLQQYVQGMIMQTHAATLCVVALCKIQMVHNMLNACLAAFTPS